MTTPVVHFTKQAVETLPRPEKGRVVYRDNEAKHLRLFVTPSSRTYYVVRWGAGKMNFVKIGEHPDMTPQQARELAGETGRKLARGESVKPAAASVTVGELFEKFFEAKAERKKRTIEKDRRMYKLCFDAWKNRKLTQVSRSDMATLHRRIGATRGQTMANRALALIRAVFNHGVQELELGIANPCAAVKPFPESSRERFMDADELGQFMAALQSEKTLPDWRDFFELSLWTGARRANVEAMRWSHINLETKTWVIPADESKNGKAMPLPLSPPAMEILTRRLNERQERTSILATARTKRAMRQRDSLTQNADFVFPSKGKSGHIVEPKKAWADMLQRAGIENLHVHDLRRTLGSWQAAGGTSLQIIGKSLGHKSQKATEIYSRLNLDPVRDSVNKATAAMQKAINKEGTR